MTISREERIESVKVGVIGGLAFCIAYGLTVAVHTLELPVLAAFQGNNTVETALCWGAAWASGFLFGVTYRYIVRDEDNPHLKSGAVAAFAIVRGVAPIELERDLSEHFLVWIIFGGESLFCCLCAFFAIDLALRKGWVQRIGRG
ncbi:hypothetical protein [Oscillatoria sp. FACHB-1406]|uniref:hypothetical protein n=1 Tax=Oscillatoria sp. FACHB-1406 TaxID=2692846 RepID=UPI0016899EBF|nr:hypothetical protein [Oscillatoria sp. FACHB-1406]MBD2578614.1 hypothetical protein [Oscillatoria sp. FACHB-1406]